MFDLTLAQQLNIITALLNHKATISDRWEAVQPLLEKLPDFGAGVEMSLHQTEPRLIGETALETDAQVDLIFQTYGEDRPDGY